MGVALGGQCCGRVIGQAAGFKPRMHQEGHPMWKNVGKKRLNLLCHWNNHCRQEQPEHITMFQEVLSKFKKSEMRMFNKSNV